MFTSLIIKIKLAVLFFLIFSFCHAQIETLTLQLPKDTIKTTSSSLSALILSHDKVYDLYNDYADALFARMDVQPTDERKRLISNMIDSLQLYSIWDSLDIFYMLASYDEQSSLLNWVSTSFNAIAYNNPEFSIDTGWTGNGSNTYINTNYTPSTDAVHYKLNNGTIGCYVNSNELVDNKALFGIKDGVAGYVGVLVRTSPTVFETYINSISVAYYNHDSYITGMVTLKRSSATSVTIYKNQLYLTGNNIPSTILPVGDVYLLTMNNYAGRFTTNTLSSFYIAGGLSHTQILKLHELTEWYLDELGSGMAYMGDDSNEFLEFMDNFYTDNAPISNISYDIHLLGHLYDGWRNQIGNKLYDLWQLIDYIQSKNIDIIDLETGYDIYKNKEEYGDYTMGYPYYPYYVVGADSCVKFRPIIE